MIYLNTTLVDKNTVSVLITFCFSNKTHAKSHVDKVKPTNSTINHNHEISK